MIHRRLISCGKFISLCPLGFAYNCKVEACTIFVYLHIHCILCHNLYSILQTNKSGELFNAIYGTHTERDDIYDLENAHILQLLNARCDILLLAILDPIMCYMVVCIHMYMRRKKLNLTQFDVCHKCVKIIQEEPSYDKVNSNEDIFFSKGDIIAFTKEQLITYLTNSFTRPFFHLLLLTQE